MSAKVRSVTVEVEYNEWEEMQAKIVELRAERDAALNQAAFNQHCALVNAEERDALAAQLAAARELLADAERAQMERDAASICRLCHDAMKPATETAYGWKHDGWGSCYASPMRRAFAALHPEPSHDA